MISNQLDLSIIVPTLNVSRTIRTTLDSLAPLRQAGAKIYLVDSNSSDGTLQIADGLFDKVLQHPKGNMYAAINAGIEAAETRWVSYLNADDIIFSDILIETLGSLRPEIDLIYGDIDFIDLHGRFLHSYRFPGPEHIIPLAASNISAISPIGTIYKKALWESLNGFDTAFRYCADFDFMLRAALAGYNMHKILHPTVGAFRLHGRQLTQETGSPLRLETRQIVEKTRLCVAKKQIIASKLLLKAGNLWEFFIRVLRQKRLSGKTGFSASTTPPDYQK